MRIRQVGPGVRVGLPSLLAAALLLLPSGFARAQDEGGDDPAPPGAPVAAGKAGKDKEKEQDFPPFKEVSKDFEKVVSTADGAESLYTLWVRKKDNRLLAELPRGFENQKHFWAMTVAAGDTWAGLQGNDQLAYWKRYDKTLALVAPNLDIRSSGDAESVSGVQQQFTDRVLLDVPIACIGPSGQPVFDATALLAARAGEFFGWQGQGANAKLTTIKSAKAFPENIEISLEMPAAGGELRTFHYSISRLPDRTGYTPRVADERVGYFTTSYRDLGKFRDDEKWIRYANRWDLQKRDPNLKQSPPKQPIIYYIENTVPVRYRRFVRDGILEWNKAFAKVGISDAIEVYYQDKTTGANMDKDPEDVRYNFVRWLSNDMGTAIGPSRVDPRTGQILDADVVLTDGWIRYFWYQANELLPEIATQGMNSETLAWFEKNPTWDPRVRLADPAERDLLLARRTQRGLARFGLSAMTPGGHNEPASGRPLSGPAADGLPGRSSQFNGFCNLSRGKGMDMALVRMDLELSSILDDDKKDDKKKDEEKKDADKKGDDAKKDDAKKDEPKKSDKDLIDGIPDWFIGPMLTDLTAHEIGHTLGLRHNFKASSLATLAQINSDEFKGKKSWSGSVMDYNPININKGSGAIQGDYAPMGIGTYDFWAIEFGYTPDDPKKVLERVSEADLVYLTDEDVGGPDPLARPYDLASDPLDYANNQIRLVEYYRGRLTDKFVKDGESWAKARRGYNITLGQQMNTLSFMAPWVGGAHVNRARKGDPNAKPPLVVVAADKQRAALKFVIDNAFRDQAFGLTPELLQYMTVDKWADAGGYNEMYQDSTFPIHDRIIGVQATALSLLMNPTRLKRVFDNEFRVPPGQDALTLPEVMNTLSDAIWTELKAEPTRQFSAREPMISSLRRNLQREHLQRLMDLVLPDGLSGAAAKPISNLATANLRSIRDRIKAVGEGSRKDRLDDYTQSHLAEAALRIDKVLDAQFIYNTDKIGGGGFPFFFFGQNPDGLSTEPRGIGSLGGPGTAPANVRPYNPPANR